MLASASVAFVHHLAAFAVVGALVAERVLFSAAPTAAQALRLRGIDAVYGASAGLLLAVGLARVHWFEKGAAYYHGNPFFLAKLALFIAVGVLSVYPTVVFLSWRKLKAGEAPVVSPLQAARIRRLLDLELAAVVAILFCAALMAKGLGA